MKKATAPQISLEDVRAAAAVIKGAVERTPTHHSRTLSKLAGCEIHLKFENLQFTASFKERGALNKLLSLSPEQRKHGVAAMSAGNHAQGVAYHAGRLGIPATIVMPEGTPFNKVKHTKDFGARVVLEGATLSECFTRAQKIASAENLTFIHPYDDPIVIAGQGTVALELLEDVPDVDTLVVPIGGGGLISGISIAAKALKPGIEIYGVEAELYPSMFDAIKGKQLPCAGQTIAEGIAVKDPGAITSAIIAQNVKIFSSSARKKSNAPLPRFWKSKKQLWKARAPPHMPPSPAIRSSSRAGRSVSFCRAAISTCGCFRM